jgi:hypothetical protein
MDEKTPHLHLTFVPLTKDNRLCAKEIIGNRANLTKWQDDFHAYMVEKYPDLERGESASKTGRKHMRLTAAKIGNTQQHNEREKDSYAKQLNSGLEEQLNRFVREHPDTRLIIIDTLQKIREAGAEKYSYADDYKVITSLKHLADGTGICLLLVHHTRKQQADDKFDMISGTNGLMGAADGAFLLQKERRTDSAATLDISGRDLQDQRLYLKRDEERLVWALERRETEPYREPPDPVLEAVAALVTVERPEWSGTATDLAAALGVDMKANALAMRLNVRAWRLSYEYHIRYESTRTHAGRNISLTLEPPQA